MKLIEVLDQIPKLKKDILISAPQIDATEKDVYFYLMESGVEIEILTVRTAMDKTKMLLDYYSEILVNPCNIQEKEYPKRLKDISTPPAIIYYKGNISCLNEIKTVAVIGTREPSEEGKRISYNLGNVLSEKGYGVVNGLAIGCDEYAPRTSVQKYNYVQRDRIQAGLSDGVIMVEAMLDSGTMHTVNYAKKFNRYITCYKEKQGRFSGNQHLIENGVLALEDNESLKVFEENINKKEYYQVTLFE